MDNEIHNTLPLLLTPFELAEFLRISRSSVYRLVAKRALPFYHVGGALRFSRDEVLRYLEETLIPSVTSLPYDRPKTR
jgi:excisionase family DNA binding protein